MELINRTPTEIMSKLICIESSLNEIISPTTVVVNTMAMTDADMRTINKGNQENQKGKHHGKIVTTDQATMCPEPLDSHAVGRSAADTTRRSSKYDYVDCSSCAPETSRCQENFTEQLTSKNPCTFQVISDAISANSHPEPPVPVVKIVKCAEQLMVVLDELRVNLPSASEHCDAVIDLINRVQWLLKDLGQTSGSSDQTRILLEKYDNYRKSYYCLRNHITDMKQMSKQCTIIEQPDANDDENEADEMSLRDANSFKRCIPEDSCSVLNPEKENGKFDESLKRLYECPGLLDVTIHNGNKDLNACCCKSADKENNPKDKYDWMNIIKNACCFCFPRQCFLFCSIK